MFSNVTSENSVSLLRLPRNEKWRDAPGKQPGELTHSQGEKEDSGRRGDASGRGGADSCSALPLQLGLKGKYKSFEPLSSTTHTNLTRASLRFHWRLKSRGRLRLFYFGVECVCLFCDKPPCSLFLCEGPDCIFEIRYTEK